MAKLKMFKRIVVRDKNGKVEYDSGTIAAHSYVIAFLEFIYGQFTKGSVNIEDVNNIVRYVRPPYVYASPGPRIKALDDDDDFGIVVGTGDTAEDNEDYKLDVQIVHGRGEGRLDYGAHSFVIPTVVGDNIDMVVSRDFYNGSGASVTVKEIGIYVYAGYGDFSDPSHFCIARDVLGTPVAVEDAKTLTVQYTIRTTV